MVRADVLKVGHSASESVEGVSEEDHSSIFLIVEQALHDAGLTLGVFLPKSILWRDEVDKFNDFLLDELIWSNTHEIRSMVRTFLAPELRCTIPPPNPCSGLWELASHLGKQVLKLTEELVGAVFIIDTF